MSLSINVKGPSDLKLAITVPEGSTVAELKGLITQANADFPADRQRLIYSGRVLKDEELCSKYGLSNGHTIHLVKGAPPAASAPPPAAAQVPSNFAAGNQIAGNPLAPLLNAEYAGALGSFNPFAEMGINTNDPNYVQNMMDDPNVQNQVNGLLQNPQIAANPELQRMGPQVRQMMQSEQFRSFLTNPEAMRNMHQMMGSGMFGGGASGAGGAGAFPAPGGAGGNAGLFNPWANDAAAATPAAGAGSPPAAGTPGAFNPFAALGGMGGFGGAGAGATAGAGGAPDFQQMMQQMQQLQQLQQQFGAPAAPAAAPSLAPEERFSTQLAQLAELGFSDATRNVRALLAAGGNVEGAVEYLFSNL